MWHSHWILAGLVPLAGWILLSGVDDLWITLVALFTRPGRIAWPSAAELDAAPERRIAVLVPLWHEYRVIGQMLQRNLSSIRYQNFEFFVGAYPNDQPTVRAVQEAARLDPRIHLAMVPHPGPTSKGDCLNWAYFAMHEFELRHGVRFEIVVTHDAEDLIHSQSLRLINWFSRHYQMVQIPVLPLPTGVADLTHGGYCDEFAEFQLKDIPVRQRLGGFLPSNGVGTGFDRAALETLADTRGGSVFDPACLTEDYENGYRLHELGYRQIFLPVCPDKHAGHEGHSARGAPSGIVATREYFPRHLRQAVRQRSRWVAGIALQGWQMHGWPGPWRQNYWLWRDRKGLVGNLLSPLANLLFLGGLTGWRCGVRFPAWLIAVTVSNFILSLLQVAARAYCTSAVYGWRFAAGVPVRLVWDNLVNFLATIQATRQFAAARLHNRNLAWNKTEHVYPAHYTGAADRGRLGEVLVRLRCLAVSDIEEALRTLPKGVRLGEHLVALRRISQEDLYRALSLHAGLDLGLPRPYDVNRLATRVLPAEIVRRWKVMPYRVVLGQLHLVTTEIPTEEMTRELAHHSTLELRFRLVRPLEFEKLATEFLPPRPTGARSAS